MTVFWGIFTVSWMGVKSPRLRSLRPRAAKLACAENRWACVDTVDSSMAMVLLKYTCNLALG